MSTSTVRNVIIFACAVDAADKALLPATFKALSEQLQVGPKELGALTFAQSIAFSLAMPMWGSMLQYRSPKDLMVFGCLLWGSVTLLLAGTSSYMQQFFLRLLVGAALAVVNPVGQAMICDLVPEDERGWSFGLLQSVSVALTMLVSFVTTSIASTTVLGMHGWRVAYAGVACLSFLAALLVNAVVPATSCAPAPKARKSWAAEQLRVVRLVAKKTSFVIMVSQGVTGGIPWNAFAFLTLFFQLSGYTDLQAGQIMFLGGFGGILGSLLGGKLGDLFNAWWPFRGRCFVAQLSVVWGTILFLWFIYVPFGPGSFATVVLAFFLFQAVACWTPAAALRPICGEIVRSSQDRAQVLALWIALEGIISSVCGAPLAGALSEAFGYKLEQGKGLPEPSAQAESLEALRRSLVGVSVIPWVLCAMAWIPMYWTYPRDAKYSRESDGEHSNLSGKRANGLPQLDPPGSAIGKGDADLEEVRFKDEGENE